jgi:heavy metal translocating P-type ATPase
MSIKQLVKFFKTYKQFGLVLLSIVAALILDVTGNDRLAHIVLILSASANAIPLVWGMIQDIREGTYGVDILAATAIITSVVMGEYWAGIIIVVMLTGGESLEDYAERRAKTELTSLLKRAPRKAHILRGRKVIDIRASEVRVNDRLIIRPGEVIPVDCLLVEGKTSLDESSLTGESLPSSREPGDNLMSGAVNLDGLITVKATSTAADSQYEQIIRLVKSAAASKAPFIRLADRYSIPFTITAFVIAGSAWALSGDSLRFLQVLVVATPCPLILSAPIALISGMSRATKHGIIIKTGSALERLAAVKTMGFDKTGTLTMGQPTVDKISVFKSFKRSEVLQFAASLEKNSNHVLAKAIIEAAEKDGIKTAKAKKVRELAGNGLEATVNGRDIVVGRLGLIQDYGVSIPKSFDPAALQQTAAFVAIDNQLAGVITFKDEIRPASKATLDQLRALGIKHTLMVTGDNKVVAEAVAKQLGISEVCANALPADKLEVIENQKGRPVGFVGDGVNDAPVLAAADVGIALGARGSTAASESADVVIMLDNIQHVALGVDIAKRTLFIAKQSILIGIGLSIGLMLIFATGRFKPVYGAAIQEVVDVIVIFNALRAHGSWKRAI